MKTNIKVSNGKTKSILLSRVKESIARVLLLLIFYYCYYYYHYYYYYYHLNMWNEKPWIEREISITESPTGTWYCERLTGTSKR